MFVRLFDASRALLSHYSRKILFHRGYLYDEQLIKLFTVYFLISRFELRIIYRGDDRRCLDYGFDDVLSCTTSPSPECNKRVVIATIERYRVLSSAIGKKKHERILFVVTRTIHLIIQPTRGCIIVALIIPITVQLKVSRVTPAMWCTLSPRHNEERILSSGRQEDGRTVFHPRSAGEIRSKMRHNRAGLTFYTNIYHVVQNNHC